jgi:hypothetical protein
MSTLSNLVPDIVFEFGELMFVSLESRKPISCKQAEGAKHKEFFLAFPKWEWPGRLSPAQSLLRFYSFLRDLHHRIGVDEIESIPCSTRNSANSG